VRDQSLLDRISRDAKAHMLVTMPKTPRSDHFRTLLNDPNLQIFYHAPVLILISAEPLGPRIIEDCALATENLMLAACAVGLGTCWIGFAQYTGREEGARRQLIPPLPAFAGLFFCPDNLATCCF
jgi:nitroreductase